MYRVSNGTSRPKALPAVPACFCEALSLSRPSLLATSPLSLHPNRPTLSARPVPSPPHGIVFVSPCFSSIHRLCLSLVSLDVNANGIEEGYDPSSSAKARSDSHSDLCRQCIALWQPESGREAKGADQRRFLPTVPMLLSGSRREEKGAKEGREEEDKGDGWHGVNWD